MQFLVPFGDQSAKLKVSGIQKGGRQVLARRRIFFLCKCLWAGRNMNHQAPGAQNFQQDCGLCTQDSVLNKSRLLGLCHLDIVNPAGERVFSCKAQGQLAAVVGADNNRELAPVVGAARNVHVGGAAA